MGRRADHCAYSLLSAGATNAVPRAQERGDGAGVGLHTLLHLCHLRPRAQAGMFPLSSHHAVSYLEDLEGQEQNGEPGGLL